MTKTHLIRLVRLISANALLLTLLLPTVPARAASDAIEVCAGNFVNTLGSDGAPLNVEDLALLVKLVGIQCDQRPLISTRIVGNVLANIHYNASNGTLYVNGIANSLFRGNYSLACVYAAEPPGQRATYWQSCGTLTKYGVTEITTPTAMTCPIPGTRWHAVATLFTTTGKPLITDDGWVYAN